MATPGIESGVVEFAKPRRMRKSVCWRFEGQLAAGALLLSPVFDLVSDGRPYSETELGSATVVAGVSPDFVITVACDPAGGTNPGAQFMCGVVEDTPASRRFHCYLQPKSGTGPQMFRWRCPGRRCIFRLLNTPLGPVPALVQTFKMTVLNVG